MKQTFTIISPEVANRAAQFIRELPVEKRYTVTIKPPTRSSDQNAKMWALLGEVSAQVDWHGRKLSAENWKDVFSASLKAQKVIPGLDGNFVVLGARTSQMTISEMSEMIELMYAFGAEKGVRWNEL